MTTDYVGATDAMKSSVLVAWNAATLATVGSVQKIFFQGVVKDGVLEVGTPDDYWARVSTQSVTQGQATLGENGVKRRHTAYGVLFVQMFFPLVKNDAWRNGTLIAKAVKNALAGRTASGTVWFRNPRINELTIDSTHHRLNVVVDFEYDEIV